MKPFYNMWWCNVKHFDSKPDTVKDDVSWKTVGRYAIVFSRLTHTMRPQCSRLSKFIHNQTPLYKRLYSTNKNHSQLMCTPPINQTLRIYCNFL